MSEQDQQRPRSPLESERGITTIKDSVVSKIAGMAAGEVEGVHMGGGVSRATGGLLGGVKGSASPSHGVSVEVGRIETAIDVTMEMEYGRNILELAESVRARITDRVENLTGLRIMELNVTISDVIFSDQEDEGRRGGPGDEDPTQEQRTEEVGAGSREREAGDTEPVRARASTEGPGDRGEVHVEGAPLERDETAESRFGDEESGRGRRREG